MFAVDQLPVPKHQISSKKIRQLWSLRTAAIVVAGAVGLTAASPAIALAATPQSPSNQEAYVASDKVSGALQNTPGLLSDSSNIQASSDQRFAIKTVTAGASVEIPKDPKNGVTLTTSGGSTLGVTLPNASQSQTAKAIAPGVVRP
jgi:hypothetical protein